jgi:hypothetical protein
MMLGNKKKESYTHNFCGCWFLAQENQTYCRSVLYTKMKCNGTEKMPYCMELRIKGKGSINGLAHCLVNDL